jgi:AcrR family transcriptional regulator
MGRRRRADRNTIIDAIGVVIQDHGLDALSIDAVAKAAGVGKATVLYDFKSKDTLIAAFVERKIRLYSEAVAETRKDYESGPDPTIRALLSISKAPPSKEDLANGMLVAAAAAKDEAFRSFLGSMFADEIARIEAEAASPRRALLAYLALHGLLSLEHFGCCVFEKDLRERTLEDIPALILDPDGSYPADSETSEP